MADLKKKLIVVGDRLLIRVLDLADDFDLAVEHIPEEWRVPSLLDPYVER